MTRRAPKPPDDQEPAGRPVWRSVRKSKVARAKALVKRKDYPSGKVMTAVAKLLARHLRSEE